METSAEKGPVPALPEGTPDDVRLHDDGWLSDQQASGARLTLVELSDIERDEAVGRISELEKARDRTAELLATERSANHAMLATVVELDRSLLTERSANRAALAAVAELERRVAKREEKARGLEFELLALQAEATVLHRALDMAERPLWRKLFRRPPADA